MIGVSICTAALVVVLSVFNGLEGLLYSLYSTFDPEIKIEAVKGKSFEYDNQMEQKISSVNGVEIITDVIEDYAYVKYRNADKVVTIKGVNENFIDQKRIDNNIVEGELKLKQDGINYAIVGRGIQYALSFSTKDDLHALQLYYIKNPRSGSVDPSKLYSKLNILPGSIFAIEQNYDENYIIVPVEFAQDLLNYGNKRTAIEIKTSTDIATTDVIRKLKEVLGDDFLIQNRHQQQDELYKLLNLEKLFVFLVFSFILAVGSINIFFSLSMLALDKKKDIAVLYAMGASDKAVKKIFLSEGGIISLGGAFLGTILGAFICLIQQKYGLVGMGTQSTVISSYPIQMQLADFVYTALSIIAITFAASYRPAVIATRYNQAHLL
ncbi:MAG: FtsX-like permease family protein [Cyclobacteriaceae bacterium]|nr:FtsX-like permease family protein [Cyclobacteriaceae bacterium]